MAASLVLHNQGKLAPRFYRPYQISEKIGLVAYRLTLPARAKIHNVFHVSLLKPFMGEPPAVPPALPHLYHGKISPLPARIVSARKARDKWQVLVKWDGLLAADASWEDMDSFRR